MPTRLTEDQVLPAIQDWLAGMSERAVAEKHGISRTAFRAWRERLGVETSETDRRQRIAKSKKGVPFTEAHKRNLALASHKAQRYTNTRPERAVRYVLDMLKIPYKQHKYVGGALVDFVIDQVVIEVYGCYWHACEQCGHSGLQYDYDKRAHDREREQRIRDAGFELIVLWEHELRPLIRNRMMV